MKPKYSVIIPVYNVDKYLSNCLDSIIIQKRSDIEIILVDDGSSDNSGNICDEYAKKYECVTVYHNTNHGLLFARRFGYEHASGEYIVNCDSDDMLKSDFFSSIEIPVKNGIDVIIFNAVKFNEQGEKTFFKDIFTAADYCDIDKKTVAREFLSTYRIVSMWCKVYKRSLVDLKFNYSQYTGLQNGEDSLQDVEIFTKAETYIYINRPLYRYRVGSGMTSKFDEKYFSSFDKVYKRIESNEGGFGLCHNEFSRLLAQRVLSTIARAITQSRSAGFSFAESKKYLLGLRSSRLFINYFPFYSTTRKYLQKNYQVFLSLLNYKLFGAITFILKVENMLMGGKYGN